ncbi:MAG: hypothetical protein IT245_01795, partial [Bacteroidia bacterium]|nr:hypothetical protein [Bacteroidia bacterium]
EHVLKGRINKLIEHGMDIRYYEYFIDVNVFDLELYKCDYILSNILIDDGQSIQSKETAAVYHMIRGAKPGIFPNGFKLDSDFDHTVLYFENYNQIHSLFEELTKNKNKTIELKQLALNVSLKYAPKALIRTLIP